MQQEADSELRKDLEKLTRQKRKPKSEWTAMRGVADTLAWRVVGAPDAEFRVDAIRDVGEIESLDECMQPVLSFQHDVNEVVFRYSVR